MVVDQQTDPIKGTLLHADLKRIEFVGLDAPKQAVCREAVQAVARGDASAASIDHRRAAGPR